LVLALEEHLLVWRFRDDNVEELVASAESISQNAGRIFNAEVTIEISLATQHIRYLLIV
jgi:hypothetical protein